ncbi:MAG: DNA polymerase IV [Hyphomicrobiales bacterium]|nr:DNA polymerase IV [Hyphomicrobiales bacterium]
MAASPRSICRDCTKQFSLVHRRCPKCGSPRVLFHDELDSLEIAHIDCDAFYASVEKRDRPELNDKPVIIGGGKRGVVATACYVARIRGVHSAMPMFKALKICPDAVVIKPDMKKYSRTGQELREMMRELTPVIEPISIDEAFLDLSGTKRLHGAIPAKVLIDMASRVKKDLGITVSIGLSYCKFLAKVASDLEKPRGFSIIGQAEAVSFLRKQPVSIVWGVGKVSQKMLAADGIHDIATIQDMEENELARRYGSLGLRLSKLSKGRDTRRVERGSGAKSISSETTFNTDKSTIKQLAPILRRLCEKVADRLKNKSLAGQTIILKMKTDDFKSRTRSHSLSDPTQLADKIYKNARVMMIKELDGSRYRLIGIGLSNFQPEALADPHDLVDIEGEKRARIEKAIDKVRDRFGGKSVELGLTFDTRKRASNSRKNE